MAEEIIRPSSDVSTGTWTTAPLYSKVNENVTQPTAGDGTYIQASATTTCQLALADVVSMGSGDICTSITVWAYTKMSSGALDALTVAYKTGAFTSSYKDITGGDGSWLWRTRAWTGLSYTQSDINDLHVLLKNTSYGAGYSYCDTVYIIITYTVSGYSAGNVMGVAPANISKVCGITISNIDNVKGI